MLKSFTLKLRPCNFTHFCVCVLAQPHRDDDVREAWVHRCKNTNTMAFSRASKFIVWELKTNIKTFILKFKGLLVVSNRVLSGDQI
jgi:hypothetical protein